MTTMMTMITGCDRVGKFSWKFVWLGKKLLNISIKFQWKFSFDLNTDSLTRHLDSFPRYVCTANSYDKSTQSLSVKIRPRTKSVLPCGTTSSVSTSHFWSVTPEAAAVHQHLTARRYGSKIALQRPRRRLAQL